MFLPNPSIPNNELNGVKFMFVAGGVDPLLFLIISFFSPVNVVKRDLEDSKSGSGATDPEFRQSPKERSRN